MPIRPFLAAQAFDPETITKMSAAYESVCAALGIKLVDDAAATRLVAQVVIELAQRGVKDVQTITAMTLERFEHVNSPG